MTTSQTTIIWLGLLLVVMNLIVNWADVKKVVFTAPPKPASSNGSLFGPILGPIISGASSAASGAASGALGAATGGLLSANTPQQTPAPVLA